MNTASSEKFAGLGLIVVGALALAVAPFLPFVEPTAEFVRIRDNTLIQHGGWLLVALAVAIAGAGYGVVLGKRFQQWVLLLGLGAAAVVIVADANNTAVRTLYPVGSDGLDVGVQPGGVVGDLGIAIYVAGTGLGIAVIGALVLLLPSLQRRSPDTAASEPAPANAATKQCPDCAETIHADARLCKHCGYRFAAAQG